MLHTLQHADTDDQVIGLVRKRQLVPLSKTEIPLRETLLSQSDDFRCVINARNLKTWKGILGKANLRLIDRETRYIRFYPPFWYNQHTYNTIISQEHSLGQKNRLLRDYLFFGINFTAESAD